MADVFEPLVWLGEAPEPLDADPLGGWAVLPNLRLAYASHYRGLGTEKAYRTLDGSICCSHGELPGTIRAWCSAERRDKARRSTCTCVDTRGLVCRTSSLKLARSKPESDPVSYFDVLCAGRDDEQVETPLQTESGNVVLTRGGKWHCPHGSDFEAKVPESSRSARERGVVRGSASLKRRFRIKTCGCTLVLPNKNTFPEVPIV